MPQTVQTPWQKSSDADFSSAVLRTYVSGVVFTSVSEGRPLSDAAFAKELARIKALHGDARLDAIWALAEQSGQSDSADISIRWLRTLMREAWKQSRIDFTLRAFGELRRIYEQDPRYADLRKNIVWYFKWLVEELPEYTEVTRQVIDQVFGEMQRFYESGRESLRPIFALRCQAAVRMGLKDEATNWYAQWQALPRSDSDDCEACDIGRQILYLADRKEFEEAMKVAAPIFAGKTYCDETPETLTRLAYVALQLKRPRVVVMLLKASSRPVRRVPASLSALASHVFLRLIMGDLVRSRRLAILALRRARDARNDLDRFHTYQSCGLWAATAVLLGKHELNLPSRLMPTTPTSQGPLPLADAAGLCLAEARRIAADFDARNGTSRFAGQLNALEEAVRKAAEGPGPRNR